jgi:hypothetical protein
MGQRAVRGGIKVQQQSEISAIRADDKSKSPSSIEPYLGRDRTSEITLSFSANSEGRRAYQGELYNFVL